MSYINNSVLDAFFFCSLTPYVCNISIFVFFFFHLFTDISKMRKRKILEISVPSDNLVTRFSPTFHPPFPPPVYHPSSLFLSLFLSFSLSLSLSFSLSLSLSFLLSLSLSYKRIKKKRLREYAIQGITGGGLIQNRNFVGFLLVDFVHSLYTHTKVS